MYSAYYLVEGTSFSGTGEVVSIDEAVCSGRSKEVMRTAISLVFPVRRKTNPFQAQEAGFCQYLVTKMDDGD